MAVRSNLRIPHDPFLDSISLCAPTMKKHTQRPELFLMVEVGPNRKGYRSSKHGKLMK